MVAKTSEQKIKNGLLPTPAIVKAMPRADLTDNARQVLMKRYVRRGDDGKYPQLNSANTLGDYEGELSDRG